MRSASTIVSAIVAALLALVGLYLLGGGIWLIVVGGSWYYVIAGIVLLATAILLWRRSSQALLLYAAFVLGTLFWALYEVGLEWWPLAARGGLVFIFGILLLLPWVTRPLGRPNVADALDGRSVHPGPLSGSGAALSSALLVAFAIAVASWFVDPYSIEGSLRTAQADGAELSKPDIPPGEWHAYGRTGFGQRYSPLDQITPENVSTLEVAWEHHTGDISQPGDPTETTFEVTPLKIGERLYLCTPHQNVIALNATTGEEIWRYDPEIQGELALQHLTCRGLSYQPPGTGGAATAAVAAPGAEGASVTGVGDSAPQTRASTSPAAGAQEATQNGSSGSMDADDGAATARTSPAQASPGREGAAPSAGVGTPAPQVGTSTPPAADAQQVAQTGDPAPSGEADELSQSGGLTAPQGEGGAAGSPPARVGESGADLPIAAATAARTRDDCDGKLFMPTADGRLIALDPETGAVCTSFGGGAGQIDLWENMPNVNPGSYYSTSPVVVTENLVIVGGTVLDNVSVNEASGVIRAFDVNTGELVWAFDPGNPDLTVPLPEGQTFTRNSANSWSISAVDEDLGLVYIPLGNSPPDQWGASRSEADERFSSSVIALNLADGSLAWVYQTVHHDLWDYDVPSQPSLIDLTIAGQTVPALVQPTKQGEIYVLNRETGEPILPVEEVPVPQGAVEPDWTAPTQPVSALSFNPDPLTESDMWGATLLDQLTCRIAFHQYRYQGRYTPPSLQGSLVYPGNFGVFNWGSIAVDPLRDIAFTTPSYLAFISRLVPRPNDEALVINKQPPEGALPALNENFGAPYAVELAPFVSVLGLPCQAPPWGYVAGADLRTGEIVWMHKNGTVRDVTPVPLPFKMGVPDLGGPMITGGNLAFMSGTLDYYVRAFNVTTGEELWQSRLPAGGQATPMSYEGSDGRQYILVVAGGHGSLGTKRGDSVIAYALPR